MSDYIYVNRTIGNTNEIFYQDGSTAFTREGIGAWSVAYKYDEVVTIRMGVYRTGSLYGFVFVSPSSISGVDIRMVSPTFVTVGTVQNINVAIGDGYMGYYNTFAFTTDAPIFNYTVFTSQSDCLHALAYGETPEPGSGVVVTINAIPIVDPPVIDGVIVHAIARLLDPNQQGGTSTIGGGQGTFDETSDPIPVPALPEISSVDTGLVSLFRPTEQQVATLGSYLWTHFQDFWENLQKLFTNPMDYFISFNIFPVKPLVTNAREIYIGNWRTSIEMPPVVSQWYELNCGTITVPEYWGSALDYLPNTRIQLMLPFIGSVQLNTDEIMNQKVGVRYRIDLLSGSCVALVTVNESVHYQFTGECAVSIPLTGADWSRIYSAVVGAIGTAIVGGVGVAAAGAGVTGGGLVAAKSYEAAAAGGSAFAAINETSKGVKGVAEMRQQMLNITKAAVENAENAAGHSMRRSEGVRNMRLANTINNTVGQVMGGKTTISHSGTISGSAGMLGVREPYLIIEYPNQSLAENYKHFVGYPSNMYARLGDLQGYTECEQVIPNGIWGTDDELAELIDSLKGGVYL